MSKKQNSSDNSYNNLQESLKVLQQNSSSIVDTTKESTPSFNLQSDHKEDTISSQINTTSSTPIAIKYELKEHTNSKFDNLKEYVDDKFITKEDVIGKANIMKWVIGVATAIIVPLIGVIGWLFWTFSYYPLTQDITNLKNTTTDIKTSIGKIDDKLNSIQNSKK